LSIILVKKRKLMSQLKVYKASAGSGKTFRLAIEYMKLALINVTNYRHILAVTFTNKATAEMKSRIIGELYQLSKGKDSVYKEVLCKELGWAPKKVETQAQLVLKRILHDYSGFSISTIDSFFQRVIKAFNRELGINAAYNVELDEKSILEEAADRMIQSVEEDPKLLEWLKAFATDKIRDGQGWNLKRDILLLGSEIFNETFKSFNDSLSNKINDRNFIGAYREKLRKIIAQYENKIENLGKEGINIISLEGLSVDDFKGKKAGPANAFQKMKDLKTDFSNTILTAANEPSSWTTATVKEPMKSKLTGLAVDKLMPKLREAIHFIEMQERNYITAKLIVNQLYTLGILLDLRKSVKDLCKEKGLILISDSGHLLKEVIADSETPFVYEKTGSIYSHFMIDEFQDTSGLQWNNFRPLIGNSLAEDNFSLVVGDVKQAIYRWRSGDWRLLAGQLDDSFPAFGIQNEILNSNWRSHGKIIRFNNTVFKLIPQILQQFFESELEESNVSVNPVPFSIPKIYEDSVQQVSNEHVSELGYVKVQFLDSKNKESNIETINNELIGAIKSLQDQGVIARDIAILVHQKKEASAISELFLKQKSLPENSNYNFDILSGESLFISNSELIAFIISVLTVYLNPDDQVVRAEANYLYFNKILPRIKKTEPSGETNLIPSENINSLVYQFENKESSENILLQFFEGNEFEEMVSGKPILEIVYSICARFDLFSLENELAYLQAFVDQISVFERNHASEITSFISWWTDNGRLFTIPVSDSINAINVQTIHKSKGLEYKYVFIPFLDWNIQPKSYQEHAPLLWCIPKTEPFNEMELVPILYKSGVGKSIFYREYFTEKFNTYVDHLNLIYVVFTRAKTGLWVWSSFSDKIKTVGDLLKSAIDNQEQLGNIGLKDGESVIFSSRYDIDKMIFEWGDITENQENNKTENRLMKNMQLSNFQFTDFRKYLNIRKRKEDFFSADNKKQSGINKGKLIHEILSMIETKNDLERAVMRMQSDGKIDAETAKSLNTELNAMLSDDEIKLWFDGTYRIVNERNILTGSNGLKRPDRIMFGKDQVIVVDYKSGELMSDKYRKQLQNYIKELNRCGYPNVTGFIWYTKTNERIKI